MFSSYVSLQGTVGVLKSPTRYRQEEGSLYCLHSNGTVTKHEDRISISNGLAWSPDNRTMYFNDTLTCCVDAFDYDISTGLISRSHVFLFCFVVCFCFWLLIVLNNIHPWKISEYLNNQILRANKFQNVPVTKIHMIEKSCSFYELKSLIYDRKHIHLRSPILGAGRNTRGPVN